MIESVTGHSETMFIREKYMNENMSLKRWLQNLKHRWSLYELLFLPETSVRMLSVTGLRFMYQ